MVPHASLFKDVPFTNSSLWPFLCSFKRQRGCDSLQQFLKLRGGGGGCRVQTVINIRRRGRGGGEVVTQCTMQVQRSAVAQGEAAAA